MSRTTSPCPLTLTWIPADASAALTIRRADGVEMSYRSAPPLPEALSAARQSEGPVEIMLRGEDGSEAPAYLVSTPGYQADALVVAAGDARTPPDEAIETLVNQIAHDVRNFAFTMGLQAEMGARRASDSPAAGHFEAVMRQVDKLKSYLEALLLFGRPPRLAPATFDVTAFVREQIQRARISRSSDAPPVSVSVTTEGHPGTVRWDGRAIAAALEQILDNALRSATPPPPIEIHIAGNTDTVGLQVRDHGDGIPPDILDKLRTPMATRRAGGAGLGVAIARKMVRAHGGTFDISSGASGTTVVMTLPREAVPV